jgi:anti-anti-sigma factor
MEMSQGGTMNIEHEIVNKTTVVMTVSGRLDTANAPLLERKLKQWGSEITEIVLDFSQLDYISSMGLRVLLQAKKTMKSDGRTLVIKNMRESVREVFQMTGFLNLMVQEEKFLVIRKNETDSIILSFNGEMETENIPAISKELHDIKVQFLKKHVKIILDMEKLTYYSPGAIKSLSGAITDTAGNSISVCIRNAAEHLKLDLHIEGLGKYVE